MSVFELIEAAKQGDLGNVKTILQNHKGLINQRDEIGATALHYAAFEGHRLVVEELVKLGAEVNARDSKFGATPAGWAIEYLREMGALLGIELSDMAHAIQQGQVEWVKRFLDRLPAFREASDPQGRPFKLLAQQCGNHEIAELFGSSAS